MILHDIVARTRAGLDEVRRRFPIDPAALQPARRDFRAALAGSDDTVALISEVKRGSPSKGRFPFPLDPADLALRYQQAGAAAISVVTEEHFFFGSGEDLRRVSAAVSVPVLRKDFVSDPYQIHQARQWGADAVLLIAAILDAATLDSLLRCARSFGMECLVEIHDREDFAKIRDLDVAVVGVNNRDLRDFTVSLETTRRMAQLLGPGRLLVSESGIFTRDDLLACGRFGARAALVGEALITSANPGAKVRELLGRSGPPVGRV